MYVVILYSFYMTLRDCMLWVYAAILVFNLLMGVLTVFTLDSWTGFIIYMLLMLFYLGVLFILNKDQHFVKEIKIPASHFMPGVSHMLNNARGKENEVAQRGNTLNTQYENENRGR